MLNIATHALNNLRRDWRSGRITLLSLAVVLAVTAVTTIGFFSDRLKQTLEYQASELLAADLVISGPEEIRLELIQHAQQMGLITSLQITFPSVVLAGNKSQLSNLKAVTTAYPLRGRLQTSAQIYGAGVETNDLPLAGEAWLESRLLQELGIAVGQTIKVGEFDLRVSRVLIYEPDRGGEFFNIAPRLMMRVEDIAKTRLIQSGSRVQHRLLVAGGLEQIQRYRTWVQKELRRTEILTSLRDARPELRVAIERGENYLNLAVLISLLLAGVAIAITARRFAENHLDQCAMMRCLGATQDFINKLFILQLAYLGFVATLIGSGLGYVIQYGLAYFFKDLVNTALPSARWHPLLTGFMIGQMTLYLFALPLILRLAHVSPLRVIRRDLSPPSTGIYGLYLSVIGLMTLFLFLQIGQWELALRFLIGGVITFILLGLVAWLLIKCVEYLKSHTRAGWKIGISNAVRYRTTTAMQIIGFGLTIMAVLILSLVRDSLLHQWRTSLPKNAPNQFVINVQSNQLAAMKEFFTTQGRSQPNLYPMVRGRLIRINNREVNPEQYKDERARRLLVRETNISSYATLEPDNRITAGHWWQPVHSEKALSVEEGIARDLGIKLGDELTYLVAGREFTGKATSLRQVNWDSIRPNFFVVAKPGLLDDYPTTWITSFHLPKTDPTFVSRLIKQFPNLTVFDVDAMITQVRIIMDKIVAGVEYVFLFTLLAGTLVLFATIEATQQQRLREGALIRALGGQRRLLIKAYIIEFSTIGILAGSLASLGATATAWFVSTSLLKLDFQFQFSWWISGTLGGAVLVGSIGLLASLPMLRKPPMQSLREL